jgi:LysM repeat protein/protein-tyrosine phosphatase
MLKLLRRNILLALLLLIGVSASAQKDMFGLDSAQTKLVNNKGIGPDYLLGLRNMRVVLHDILYRGGSNNFYRKEREPKTYNSHPLPPWGINNLRQAGFGGAIYLYSKYFEDDYPEPVLDSLFDLGFNYSCQPDLNRDVVFTFFEEINTLIRSEKKEPLYIHCWNGWHQSGMLSAFTLMQFCGLNNQQALKYWEQNTDGAFKGYPHVKSEILKFKPFDEFKTDSVTRARICPCMSESVLKTKDVQRLADVQHEGDSGQRANMEVRDEKLPVELQTHIHVVKSGESLSTIAEKEHTSVKTLCRENNIHESSVIRIDQKLIVPGPKRTSTEVFDNPLQKYHKVKSGDTLSGLAIKHHTTVAKICKLNNFKPTKTLKIGEKIRVH